MAITVGTIGIWLLILRNKNSLKNHLSNNLKISGVPKALKNTVFTFEYNNFDTI